MKYFSENPWFTIPVLCFFCAGLTANFVLPFGEEILMLNHLRVEPLNTFFRLCTLLGEPYVFFLFGIPMLVLRCYRFALMVALTGLLTIPTVHVIKKYFKHDRPATYFEKRGRRDLIVTVPGEKPHGGRTSFPSGHTMAAFGLYAVLAFQAGPHRRPIGLVFALMAILVALSRMFLVQHFLADVLSGALLGLIMAWAVWKVNNLLPPTPGRRLDREGQREVSNVGYRMLKYNNL